VSSINPVSSLVNNLMGSPEADRPNRPHLQYPGGVNKLGQDFPKIGEGGPIGQISAIIKDTVEISSAARMLAGQDAAPKPSSGGSGGPADAMMSAIALSLVA
jgi:hypothetical protein